MDNDAGKACESLATKISRLVVMVNETADLAGKKLGLNGFCIAMAMALAFRSRAMGCGKPLSEVDQD